MLFNFLVLAFKYIHELLWFELVGHELLTLTRHFNFFDGTDAAKGSLDSLAIEKKIS
jgi:hypothetical protein